MNTNPKTLTKHVTMRVPEELRDTWHKMAEESGLNLSDWMRAQLEGKIITGLLSEKTKPKPPNCDPKLLMILARISNNFNQIAVGVNECRKNGYEIIPWHAVESLYDMADCLNEIKKINGIK
jgi:hypothetical protein